ncbi:hypothetical protein ALC57_02710 [Trachymyrmex cornetzi]|uniref:Uncharacterized protein n=1 Tax=Trachymyrmex cornetzi TaxID=471704 RepID=A0A151JNI6_9HYME|nr:hypothetical protein ALC57_02710 [Trachymyrmex cornetzi]
MGTADLPAKSDFFSFVQFNGDYGCPSCYCKGENIPIIPNCNEQFCQCEHREKHYAIVQQIITDVAFVARGDNFIADTNFFLRKCYKTENCIAIPIETLKYICIFMKIDEQMYVGIPVNQKELE